MVDIGMIKKAGIGIAFNAPDEVQSHADIITNDFRAILDYI
jgi:phosphoserine phosphatase